MLAFLQHVERDEAVVRRGLGVVEDAAQLRQMAGPEEVRDVADGLGGEPREAGVVDGQDRLAAEGVAGDEVAVDAAIGGRVLAVREHFLEAKLGHRLISPQRHGDTKGAGEVGCWLVGRWLFGRGPQQQTA